MLGLLLLVKLLELFEFGMVFERLLPLVFLDIFFDFFQSSNLFDVKLLEFLLGELFRGIRLREPLR